MDRTEFNYLLGLILFILVLVALPSKCQELIMNQPSADIVDKGHLFIRADSFYTQKPAPGAEHFFQQTNFAYGLGHNLELSLNGSDLAHNKDIWQIIPGFKWAPVKTKIFEFYVGDQFYQPLSNKPFNNGNNSYEALAYKYNSFRFTAGSYQSYNVMALGNRAGVLGGVEWTSKTFSNGWYIMPGIDYASGAGINGYISPGLMFQKKNFFLCPGYMIANPHNPNGAHQSFVMIGDTF